MRERYLRQLGRNAPRGASAGIAGADEARQETRERVKMASTQFKVKFEGVTVAQFVSAHLAIHFVNSIPGQDFVINYDNRTNLWNTAKEGTPSLDEILKREQKFNEESDARFQAKMEKFRKAREEAGVRIY